jgi:hypothetical protein
MYGFWKQPGELPGLLTIASTTVLGSLPAPETYLLLNLKILKVNHRNSLNLSMDTYNPLENGWITSLGSSDSGTVLLTLHEIRNSGSVKLLPILFKLINKDTDPIVRNEILNLLGEIRSPEAVPLIAASFDKNDFGDYLPAFVAACWQSGLDFSKYLRVFAGLFIQADYITALEAFTVIEESMPNASEPEIYECISFLKDAECMVTDEKLPLFRELRKVVESS